MSTPKQVDMIARTSAMQEFLRIDNLESRHYHLWQGIVNSLYSQFPGLEHIASPLAFFTWTNEGIPTLSSVTYARLLEKHFYPLLELTPNIWPDNSGINWRREATSRVGNGILRVTVVVCCAYPEDALATLRALDKIKTEVTTSTYINCVI